MTPADPSAPPAGWARLAAALAAALLLSAVNAPIWATWTIRTPAFLRYLDPLRVPGVQRIESGVVWVRDCPGDGSTEQCSWRRHVRALSGEFHRWVWFGRGTFGSGLLAALCLIAIAVWPARRRTRLFRAASLLAMTAGPVSALLGVLWIGPLRPALLRGDFELGAGAALLAIAAVVGAASAAYFLRRSAWVSRGG